MSWQQRKQEQWSEERWSKGSNAGLGSYSSSCEKSDGVRKGEKGKAHYCNNMEEEHCGCGRRKVMKTSWTDLNPGRRFMTCPKNGCKKEGAFNWVDPPVCPRAVQIIPGLLRRLNTMESQLSAKQGREKKLWIFLVLSWVIMFAMWNI